MRHLLRIAKKHPEASASALKTSAAVPTTGFAFVDNSQGASAATAELSGALDSALDQIDFDGDLDGKLRLLVHQLDQEASKYQNSLLSNDRSYDDWKCSPSKAQLVAIAWKCAAGTYDPGSHVTDTEYCAFTQDHVITPSVGGSVKAATITIAISRASAEPKNELLPVLVVAIRGTASKVDHMVNANGRPKSAKNFIDLGRLGLDPCQPSSDFQAHSGFLNSAEALDSIVSQRINHYLERRAGSVSHVLFAGHSAGGAVASLLYLRHLSLQDPSTRLSLITFGAPPSVTLIPWFREPQTRSSPGLCLNIINEFDIVSRADEPYVLCLVNLIRSIYGQPLLPSNAEATHGHASPALKVDSLSQMDSSFFTGHSSYTSDSHLIVPTAHNFPVSKSHYHHIGSLIVLSMRLQGSPQMDRLRLRAVEVPRSELEKLLFCRIAVHRRACYAERVQLIMDGHFNGENGWNTQEHLKHDQEI